MKLKCDECGKTFKHKGWLKQHIAAKHLQKTNRDQFVGQPTDISISVLANERDELLEKARFIDELLVKFAR